MMIGVAQLVLNTADLDAVRGPYLAKGWKETFRADRHPNHPEKIPFQALARTALDVSHLACTETTAIEVTRYAGRPPAGTTVYELEGEGISLCARNAAASRAFWQALGFTSDGENVLQAPAIFPTWQLRLTLRPSSGERPRTSVDADGCVLVTLLTTALERDLRRLAATGLLVRFTSAWEEYIGGRAISVAFLEGPSGELVELLQVSGGVR